MKKTIKGFKGFDRNMQCRGFQFKVGKEYETEEAKACETGFHFCEHPLDVFSYYPPAESVYHAVEGGGKTDNHDDDTKIACTKIKIGSRVSLSAMIEAAISFTFERADKIKGSHSTGDRGAASATGKHSIACGLGFECKAMGALGCWFVLAEREWNGEQYAIKTVKTAEVDGKTIMPEVWYTLKNGKFVEA